MHCRLVRLTRVVGAAALLCTPAVTAGPAVASGPVGASGLVGASGGLAAPPTGAEQAASGFTVTRVSLGHGGTEAVNGSRFPDRPSISASGRYVAFMSLSPDLVAGDTNGQPDVFVRDRLAGTTVRASVNGAGRQTRSGSGEARISANGRVVVFTSAEALVPADTNRRVDVYARDLWASTTTLVSAGVDGVAGNGNSFLPDVSGDGRLVAFQSTASNLGPTDPNGIEDIYVKNLRTGVVERASLPPKDAGRQAAFYEPRLSHDGRVVLYASVGAGADEGRMALWARDLRTGVTSRLLAGLDPDGQIVSWSASATGRHIAFGTGQALVAADRNGAFDAYRLDRQTGRIVLISQSSAGQVSSTGSDVVDLSADGRVALFTSVAGNLVRGDTNGLDDVFRRDVAAGTTTRVSVSTSGRQGNAESGYTRDVAISADGRHLAFVSFASNLVAGDRNDDPDVFVWSLAGDH